MDGFTPMMQQYLAIKRQYTDSILFFRLGDFYEMFFEDALLASRVLEIALTARDGGKEKVPMCGIPYHAANNYIARLINQGYKVAICEQVEDPRLAKGIVKREVIRVITPGTVVDEKILVKNKNNYLLALCGDDMEYGLAYVDISTGEFKACQFREAESSPLDEVTRLRPAECIIGKR
ncbi:MAG TPA: DNA mismatch repair protein MutS, partial [Clostridia bacterium]|nr:DNA mismatch repair protein MutS [Clostridia bacterium]